MLFLRNDTTIWIKVYWWFHILLQFSLGRERPNCSDFNHPVVLMKNNKRLHSHLTFLLEITYDFINKWCNYCSSGECRRQASLHQECELEPLAIFWDHPFPTKKIATFVWLLCRSTVVERCNGKPASLVFKPWLQVPGHITNSLWHQCPQSQNENKFYQSYIY